MRRILLIVVALILYGSLYPWQFHARHYAAGPFWILLHSWPAGFDRYTVWDVAVNVALYLPLGIFGYLAIGRGASRLMRIASPLALALVLSSCVEMIQLYDDSRVCSLSDVASNVAGTAVGMALASLYQISLPRTAARLSGASLLAGCWLGYQLFPLFPAWGRTALRRKLHLLVTGTISPVDSLVVLAEWLTLAYLLESTLGKKGNRVLALLLVVLPARLLIADRTLAWSDILGTAAAFAVWFALPRRSVKRALPVLLAVALVLAELAPFHLSSPHAFNWIPFRGFFETTWQLGFVVLFRKSFWYGSLLWLCRVAGYRLAAVTALVAAALLLLEWVQVYLPGRTPEVSDAVLAVLMGVLLWLTDDVHSTGVP
jgi:VanZ family protein